MHKTSRKIFILAHHQANSLSPQESPVLCHWQIGTKKKIIRTTTKIATSVRRDIFEINKKETQKHATFFCFSSIDKNFCHRIESIMTAGRLRKKTGEEAQAKKKPTRH